MFDLMIGIDRRLKYLDGALPVQATAAPVYFTNEDLIERLRTLLPQLTQRAAGHSPGALEARERLSRILILLSKGRQRRLAVMGKSDGKCYVFDGAEINLSAALPD